MNKIYLTSDLHIGHDKPFIYEKRGFSNIREHDRAIIDYINDTVEENDILYILGDLCMKGSCPDLSYAEEMLSQIKCKNVKVIAGNHETPEKINMYRKLGFEVNVYGAELFEYTNKSVDGTAYTNQRIVLSHYPTITSNGPLKGTLRREVVNFFGHTHQNEMFYMFPNDIETSLSMHIGIDTFYKPIFLEDALKIMSEKYKRECDKSLLAYGLQVNDNKGFYTRNFDTADELIIFLENQNLMPTDIQYNHSRRETIRSLSRGESISRYNYIITRDSKEKIKEQYPENYYEICNDGGSTSDFSEHLWEQNQSENEQNTDIERD